MGRILDCYTKVKRGSAPRYRYYPDDDALFMLLDEDSVERHGIVVDEPYRLPYYVPLEDRLGLSGVWLYWPNDWRMGVV